MSVLKRDDALCVAVRNRPALGLGVQRRHEFAGVVAAAARRCSRTRRLMRYARSLPRATTRLTRKGPPMSKHGDRRSRRPGSAAYSGWTRDGARRSCTPSAHGFDGERPGGGRRGGLIKTRACSARTATSGPSRGGAEGGAPRCRLDWGKTMSGGDFILQTRELTRVQGLRRGQQGQSGCQERHDPRVDRPDGEGKTRLASTCSPSSDPDQRPDLFDGTEITTEKAGAIAGAGVDPLSRFGGVPSLNRAEETCA